MSMNARVALESKFFVDSPFRLIHGYSRNAGVSSPGQSQETGHLADRFRSVLVLQRIVVSDETRRGRGKVASLICHVGASSIPESRCPNCFAGFLRVGAEVNARFVYFLDGWRECLRPTLKEAAHSTAPPSIFVGDTGDCGDSPRFTCVCSVPTSNPKSGDVGTLVVNRPVRVPTVPSGISGNGDGSGH